MTQPVNAWSKLTATVHLYRRRNKAPFPGRSRANVLGKGSVSLGWKEAARRDEPEVESERNAGMS